MTDSMHQQLLGHLLGALDDDEQEWLESRLQIDEEYRRQWRVWRRRLAPLLAARPDTEPPPGLAEQTCRLVASFAPVPKQAEPPRRAMSPDAAFPAHSAHAAWLDVAVAALILLVIGIVVPPAINNSRFHSRLASCQDKLRQVGLALAEYGDHHGAAISELADHQKLTTAGQFAAQLLDEGLAPDDGRVMCSDAWLAVQGALRWSRHMKTSMADASGTPADMFDIGQPMLSGPPFESVALSDDNWPGTWRNGTIDGTTPPAPADLALLADAPSADLPGQSLDCHDGQGRNMFFADGHVDFIPCSAPCDAADTFLSGGDSSNPSAISVPIRFADWH